MKSSGFPRLTRPLLLTSACVLLGLGMINVASAEHEDQDSSVLSQPVKVASSGFFSFSLISSDTPLIKAGMVTGLEQGKVDRISLRDAAAMKEFYEARGGKPYWLDSRGAGQDKLPGVLKILEDSWTQALNPDNYHVAEIRELQKSDAPEDKAKLELLLTDGVIRYGHDMTGMHMPVGATREDPQFWRKAQNAGETLAAVTGEDDPAEALNNLMPRDALYTRLREELVTLVSDTNRSREAGLPMRFDGVLRPGDFARDVPKLRERLGLIHEKVNGSEKKYDDALAAAVMVFQRQNGMEADGHVGLKTLALLNRSSEEKIGQIIANMERLRWLDENRPDRYILVNIPSQTLWAVDHGNVALEMPVIVGRPERATKIFVTEITGVRFNPQWHVPPTIKQNDMLTHLQEDPTYLEQKGIELSQTVDGHRETLDPSSIDWSQVSKAEISRMNMVQGAGDNNALGKVRVLMPNPYDIYLHDTSQPELFSKQDRTISSGCIRLSNPEAVARFILTDNDNWSDKKMRSIIDSGRTTEISAAQKMPVYIVYQSIWLDDAGRLVYGPDVYKKDRALLGAMNSLKVYHIPELQQPKFASIGVEQPIH
jgi:murein L,D-transpeptidase YcbB/YkuD